MDPDAAIAHSDRPVDMVKELGDVLERMKTSAPKDWTLEDRRKAKFAFKCVVAMVYQDARVVISTNNNLGGGLVWKHSRANAEFIFRFVMKIRRNLGPVAGHLWPKWLKQLKPAVISDCPNLKNEFAKQLTESLSDLKVDTMSVICQNSTS